MTTPPPAAELRILIVAEHASRRFGGEAALPMQYYDHLRRRGVPTWLLTHERVRPEFEGSAIADQVLYVNDQPLHRLMWRLGRALPSRIEYVTTNYISRLLTQSIQRQQIRRLVKELSINLVHQPMPVSPKEPSLLHGLGVPVVIGPMNGGMDFPPAFKSSDPIAARLFLRGMRWLSNGLHALMPGKREAAMLLVANERTRLALPSNHSPRVEQLVENGVDLRLWHPRTPDATQAPGHARYVFMGRLVDVKRVDLLLNAFAKACQQQPMSMLIIGDGPLLPQLQQQAAALGILSPEGEAVSRVHFAGWMNQVDAAERLQTQDCLVLPSIRECGGAVVLEAMAASLPVIAVRWGGPADYLDESCGILIDPDGPEHMTQAMSQALVTLAQDPALRRELGVQGRAKIEREFDWEKKIDAILNIYGRAQAHAAGRPTTPPSARAEHP